MAPRNLISVLPSDVLLQLHIRLVDSNFGEYSEHSVWMLSLGYEISKSSIHRYGMENEEQIRLSVSASDKSSDEIRLRCLELAERLIGASDNDSLFKKADELLNWVRAG
jgi:hypothetical protein